MPDGWPPDGVAECLVARRPRIPRFCRNETLPAKPSAGFRAEQFQAEFVALLGMLCPTSFQRQRHATGQPYESDTESSHVKLVFAYVAFTPILLRPARGPNLE